MIGSSHKDSNREGKKTVFHHFFLASQDGSHSVLLDNAVHCPRWFLSMGSCRLHSIQ